jgi:hypothetical protein
VYVLIGGHPVAGSSIEVVNLQQPRERQGKPEVHMCSALYFLVRIA